MSNFEDTKEHVINFIDDVNNELKSKELDDEYNNSVDGKLKYLNKCKDDAKEICLDTILSQIYKDAIPLNDDYKLANAEDLDQSFKDFIATRCPKGISFYIKEENKKGNSAAKRILEAVEDLVDQEYYDKAMNIEDIDRDDIPFKVNDTIVTKLDNIKNELSAPELSQIIKDNVKQTALNEITTAKDEKQDLKNFEDDLANDVNVRDAAAVERAAELHDINTGFKDYNPTLFEAVMINKINKLNPIYEAGELHDKYLYNTIEDIYGTTTESEKNNGYATLSELAFIESVKEYTGISMFSALGLDKMNKYRIKELTDKYSQERF